MVLPSVQGRISLLKRSMDVSCGGDIVQRGRSSPTLTTKLRNYKDSDKLSFCLLFGHFQFRRRIGCSYVVWTSHTPTASCMPLSTMTNEQRLNVVEQESEAPQTAFTSACPTTFPSSTNYLAAAYARAVTSIESTLEQANKYSLQCLRSLSCS